MADEERHIAVSIERKINLGNYESAGVGIVLSGVMPGTPVEEIDEMLDTARIMFDRMRDRLQQKIAEARKETMP